MIKSLINCADNLKIVVNKLKLFLKSVWSNYDVLLEKNKARLFNRLREVLIFRDVIVFVTSFVMLQVLKQYKRLYCKFIAISICIDSFNKTMKLLCTHKIQKQWYDRANDKVLKLKNFHAHWQYIKSTAQTNTENIEILETSSSSSTLENILRVQKLAMIKVKDRSSSALNRAKTESEFISSSFTSQQRRQQAFKRFTRRKSSEFELMNELSSTTISNNQSSAWESF